MGILVGWRGVNVTYNVRMYVRNNNNNNNNNNIDLYSA